MRGDSLRYFNGGCWHSPEVNVEAGARWPVVPDASGYLVITPLLAAGFFVV